jgi:cobyrinic acid a,c-diamide synthase
MKDLYRVSDECDSGILARLATTGETIQTGAVLIAATHSGAGKTTATATLIRALRTRGLDVQPFKLGPDFIDGAYHAEAAGRPTVNLDLWMMGEDGVRDAFQHWSCDVDVAVIEAMGALYDGAGGRESGSAAELAKLLDLPVVLVLDVWGMTRTAAAILDGMRQFDPEVRLAGCILNRVGSERHRQMVEAALSDDLRQLVLGAIPYDPDMEIPERHLGLLTAEENRHAKGARDAAQHRAVQHLELDRLTSIARAGQVMPGESGVKPPTATTAPRARLAIARDNAFCFYYEDNLRLLVEAGFELVPFRPTLDPRLPANVDAIYIGGGYPESFAADLAANISLAAELREHAAGGAPIYAECGGLVYLSRSLVDFDGVRHRMSGVLPLDVAMDSRYLAIAYVETRTCFASPLGEAGTVARGQEFHQSRVIESDLKPGLFELTTSEGEVRHDGYLHRGVLASYVHLHLGSAPGIAGNLLEAALASPAPARLQPHPRASSAPAPGFQ